MGTSSLDEVQTTGRGCIMSSMPKAKRIYGDAAYFGAIIRRLRTERGWNLVKFAQRSGMNATYLSVLEKGRNTPSLFTLFELADVLNVPAAEIVSEIEQLRKASPQAPS